MDNKRLSLLHKLLLILIPGLGFLYFVFLFISLSHVPFFKDNQPTLIIEDKIFNQGRPFILERDQALVSYTIIKENLDSYIYWDTQEDKVIITTYNKTVHLKTDSLTALVNTKPVDISFPVRIEGEPYVPIGLVEELYGIKVRVLPEEQRVIIDKNLESRKIARLKADSDTIKFKPSWISPYVEEVEKSDTLYVFGIYNGWYKVRTLDGVFGFISQRKVEVSEMKHKKTNPPETPKVLPGHGKLNIVWDYIYKVTPDKSGEKPPKGLDVISPTWFSIIDGNGKIESKADLQYVKWAHENNLAVWALIDNNFDPKITHEFLSSSEVREHIIRQILVYADLFKLDGINIDFENINLEDKSLLVQFIRELTPVMHEAGLTVSMDITVKSTSANWSLCYDRKELGKIVDYLMLMAYDEHWATSPVSGSVASIGWVERGIVTLLEEVPPEKVILGLPFYTREWEETEAEGGGLSVTSKALSMAKAKEIVQKNKAQVSWDEQAGQNFAYYRKGEKVYKIWIEDEQSIKLKTDLVLKYDLAGAAAWRKGFEEPQIWNVLYDNLKAPFRL
jgi:spore germination protein YaaH